MKEDKRERRDADKEWKKIPKKFYSEFPQKNDNVSIITQAWFVDQTFWNSKYFTLNYIL